MVNANLPRRYGLPESIESRLAALRCLPSCPTAGGLAGGGGAGGGGATAGVGMLILGGRKHIGESGFLLELVLPLQELDDMSLACVMPDLAIGHGQVRASIREPDIESLDEFLGQLRKGWDVHKG